jgi:Trp operon repressor
MHKTKSKLLANNDIVVVHVKRENGTPFQNKHGEMEHFSTQVEQQHQHQHQQIEWRRTKVLELSSQGHSQREIAAIIHVGIGTVNRDLSYLSKQAQNNLKTHIQQRLPEQYQKCVTGLNQVLKISWNVVNSDSCSPANRLQALALINDSYKYLKDLITNGVVIMDAIKYFQGRMEHLNKTEKVLLHDIKEDKEKVHEEDVELQKTTNRIF